MSGPRGAVVKAAQRSYHAASPMITSHLMGDIQRAAFTAAAVAAFRPLLHDPLLRRVPSATTTTSTSSSAPTITPHHRTALSKKVRVVPYGVMGVQLAERGLLKRVASVPPSLPERGSSSDPVVVVVDPIRLRSLEKGTKNCTGAAAALYKWVGEKLLPREGGFPESVRQRLTGATQACLHEYEAEDAKKVLIHTVGPDLANAKYNENEAQRELSLTYANILVQFAGWLEGREERGVVAKEAVLRLIPVSEGMFAGGFRSVMPELTVHALTAAVDCLPPRVAEMLTDSKGASRIELCIFDAREYEPYQKALASLRANLVLSDNICARECAEGVAEALRAA